MWTFVVCIFILVHFIFEISRKPPRFPPGPIALPIIGNLLSVRLQLRRLKLHHLVWQAWSKQYGSLVGLKLGFTNAVIVFGKDYIKEVSARDVFSGRPDGFFYLMRSFDKKLGLVFSDGEPWQRTRCLVLKYLKNFGYGTRFMESYISEECKALLDLRMDDAGQAVTVNGMFDVAIVNILWRLVAGKRYDLTDTRLKNLCYLVTRAFHVVDMSGGVLNFVPLLRHFIPGTIGYTELREINDSLYKFLNEVIKEHQETIDVKNPRDVIDTFLIAMMHNRKGSSVTQEELQVVCLDLLQAGLETVGNTAVFLILYLVREQRIQTCVRREIDEVVGRDRSPTLGDRPSMVYTEAVIMEALRMSSVPAVGIPHMTLDDAKLGPYNIPKGTLILLALHDLHNGVHWPDPATFRPDRFLTKEQNIIQDEWLMPFGAGKRRCLGESLARSELFMFLTHLVQRFNLRVPAGDPMPSTEVNDGVSLSAKPFRVVFEPRK